MALKFNKNTDSPSISDTLKVEGTAQDLTGCAVKFRMRAVGSSTLKVDAAAVIVNATQGQLRYDWGVTDLDTAGEYEGWWRVTLPSARIQETEEFLIIVDDHTSGIGVTTGEVYQRVRAHLPSTWNALSKDPNFGDVRIQQRIDLVKYRLFDTVVNPTLEGSTYNSLVLDYVAKLAVLEIIPAAVDYWSNNPQSITVTGTQESVVYPDRIAALWLIYERVWAEVRALQPEIEGIISIKVRRRGGVPRVDTKAADLITPDGKDFGKKYVDPLSTHLPWSWKS